MDSYSWTEVLTGAFPNLSSEGFDIVDEPSEQYNCIAYAAGDTSQWWWPDGVNYWPPWATLTTRIESLTEAFAGKRYERCNDYEGEDGYHKVALYEAKGQMQHAAAQMPNGRWGSKMGRGPVHRTPQSQLTFRGALRQPNDHHAKAYRCPKPPSGKERH